MAPLLLNAVISVFLLDTAWRREGAETRSPKPDEGVLCAHHHNDFIFRWALVSD